jgi:hypothetical protein
MNQIARRIIYDRYRRNYCLNNYTPPSWWECDVFELTASGFFREYEIKQSRADFFKDASKDKRHYQGFNESTRNFDYTTTIKHDQLKACNVKGPSRFYFVTPRDLIETSELPTFAGLIEWTTNDGSFPWNIVLNTKVEAPQLHRCKFTEDRRRKLLEACYWRYHNLSSETKYPADESQAVAV